MNEFELEATKKLTEMVNSIELKKNEILFKEFLDSVKLTYDISDSLAPDDRSRVSKKGGKKSDDIMNVGDQLLDSQIELIPSPDVKLTKPQVQKKAELRPAKSMLGNNFDEAQLKLNLKQPAMQQPPPTQQPQGSYFNNYQTNRVQNNPYLMADKLDPMSQNMPGGIGGMMTGRLTTPSHSGAGNPNFFHQSMNFQDTMNYMTQPSIPQSMSTLH